MFRQKTGKQITYFATMNHEERSAFEEKKVLNESEAQIKQQQKYKKRIKEMRSAFPRIHVSPRFKHTKYVCVSSPCVSVSLYSYFVVLKYYKRKFHSTHFAFNSHFAVCIRGLFRRHRCCFLLILLSLLGILCLSNCLKQDQTCNVRSKDQR